LLPTERYPVVGFFFYRIAIDGEIDTGIVDGFFFVVDFHPGLHGHPGAGFGLAVGGGGFEEGAQRGGVDQKEAILTFGNNGPTLDALHHFIEGDSPDLGGHVRDDPTGHSFAPCKPILSSAAGNPCLKQMQHK